jgi:1,4-dihydroxy-2-naphthoate octaprenyltransferase
LRLSYRGLGELAVALAYGPTIVLGTYLVQTGAFSATLVQLSAILGLLVAAFLWINQFPDCRADESAGKRNLVVRLGPSRAAIAYLGIMCGAYLWLALVALSDAGGAWLLPGFLGAVPAALSVIRLLSFQGHIPRLVPAQAAALASFLLMSAGCGLGYVLFR